MSKQNEAYDELYKLLNTFYTSKIINGEGFDYFLDRLNELVGYEDIELPVNTTLQNSILITNEPEDDEQKNN